MMRSRGLLLPVALIAIGVLVLLTNLGVLSQAALERLADLWPLLLIIAGIQLIVSRLLPRPQARALGLAAAAVIVIGAIAYAAVAPANSVGTQHAESSEPLGGLNAATLQLGYGASSIEIRDGAMVGKLYQASVDYPGAENPPTFALDQTTGRLEISQSSSFGAFRFFGNGQRRLVLTLSDSLPWTIRVSGGASSLRVNLPEAQVSSLELSGGASSVDARLGKPRGTVAVRLSGGASSMTLHLPSGSEWAVSVTGGISGLTVDGSNSNAVGDITRQSSGYNSATDRFEVRVSGGVSHLDLQTK